jgi:hypothetical protein
LAGESPHRRPEHEIVPADWARKEAAMFQRMGEPEGSTSTYAEQMGQLL